ncbi:hypothetical protein L249_3468 [Ophiocordyceps polyrhachis-furcata BCC 54312]|uniref:DNA repair protein REV1 n=1 Tax=Ophiocordyceps polyrhachis-furcata BCC 54312 TaxID=1330021 RepID=A0A367LLX7_9HYPO|nr:hypothetical protein L249_3468 [Ophiocordyceps polyrhachis-furcata BCC 54312]
MRYQANGHSGSLCRVGKHKLAEPIIIHLSTAMKAEDASTRKVLSDLTKVVASLQRRLILNRPADPAASSEPPPPNMGSVLDKNSSAVRKRIEKHSFDNEDGEEYEASKFHGFGDYFRRKKVKLQNLDAATRAASEKPQIFKGIVAHIVEHGGGFLQYLDSKTMATHIIASALPPKKTVDFGRYRIVKPAWIVDSVQAGKLLPWSDYRLANEGPRQKVLKLDGDRSISQTSPEARRGYREQTDNSFYTSQMKATTAGLPSQGLSQVVEKLQTPPWPGPASSRTPERSKTDMTGLNSDWCALGASGSPKPPSSAQEPPTTVQSTVSKQPTTDRGKNVAAKKMTSEEHNSLLLSDPRFRKSSTANPDFLKQFYSESRLHHLSTWKANLKSTMQRMATEKCLYQEKPRRRPGERRYVLHVDFDSFFCAVSMKRHPELADKPSVVAHSPGPGSEIASCNYPARKFGVKNGMWMRRALELCPDLKVLPYDFPAYEEASRLFYESILSIGGVVQSVSVDEALIDVTSIVSPTSDSQAVESDQRNIERGRQNADDLALSLRQQIKAKTGCDVSVGIGGNILQAKIALRRAKPAGQFQLKPEQVLDVIGELRVEELPGVSYSIGGKLEELGIRLVKDIRDVSKERLASALGPKTGDKLADYARGIDRTEVGEQPPRKSVSAEVNWGIRFLNQQEAEEFVYNLCRELEKRLVSEQVKGKHLTIKIMRRCLDAPLDAPKHLGHGKCDSFNKSAAFGVATHSYDIMGKEAVSMLRSFKFSPGDLRGLGIQMTKLEPIKVYSKAPGGSQRTLAFNAFAGPSPARKPSRTEQIDDVESPGKARSPGDRDIDMDPITEDPITPRKQSLHPAMALSRAAQDDAKAKTPLNVSGTQFLIPSNPDPAVIAELPYDIRRRLMGQRARCSPPRPAPRSDSPVFAEELPSQVDPQVFNALPEEMKAEVLATYGRKRQRRPSPRKDGDTLSRRPTGRGGMRGSISKARRQRDSRAGVMQTTFKAAKRDETPTEDEVVELDPEFLAELPEDVRQEVVADHRRRRLARRSGLEAAAHRHRTSDADVPLPGEQRRIQFPEPRRKIAFGSGVTSTQEIKGMLDAWHGETRDDGPHADDVEVFERYLTQLVLEEADLEKAVMLVKWLDVLVQQDGGSAAGCASWRQAARQVKEALQGAVGQRGLAPLNIWILGRRDGEADWRDECLTGGCHALDKPSDSPGPAPIGTFHLVAHQDTTTTRATSPAKMAPYVDYAKTTRSKGYRGSGSFATFMIIGPTCFFLGILFASFPYDFPLLWTKEPAGDDYYDQLEAHLKFLHHSPPLIGRMLNIVVSVGFLGLFIKLFRPSEANFLFDGASLILYTIGVAVYVSNIVQGLRTLSSGLWDSQEFQDNREGRFEGEFILGRKDSLKVLAASNTILALVLIGVLVLQAGQWYAEKRESDDDDNMDDHGAGTGDSKSGLGVRCIRKPVLGDRVWNKDHAIRATVSALGFIPSPKMKGTRFFAGQWFALPDMKRMSTTLGVIDVAASYAGPRHLSIPNQLPPLFQGL